MILSKNAIHCQLVFATGTVAERQERCENQLHGNDWIEDKIVMIQVIAAVICMLILCLICLPVKFKFLKVKFYRLSTSIKLPKTNNRTENIKKMVTRQHTV